MPGILGIVSRRSARSCIEQLDRMLAAVRHDGFFHSGTYTNKAMGVYLGWTSHAGAPNDYLPVVSARKDVVLLITGEVIGENAASVSDQPAEYKHGRGALGQLLCGYEESGVQWVSGLNGCFAGALVDLRVGRFYLFNDRYGMERLFVHDVTEDFYFASEAKALLAAVPDTRSFDVRGLGELLTCGCTLGERSLYKNISVMPAASLWKGENKALSGKTVYFQPTEWSSQPKLGPTQFLDRFLDTLPRIVTRLAKADSTVGISLTGGFDSRVVVACLGLSAQEFPCYTFGSMIRDTRDVIVARQVAEQCRCSHTVLTLGREFLDNFPHYLDEAVYHSDGYLGLPGAGELYLNSMARRIAPIRLTGNYGSELIRGARAFKAIPPTARFLSGDWGPQIREAVLSFRQLERADPISFALFHQAPKQGFGRLAVEKSQLVMRTPFLDDEFAQLMYLRPDDWADGTQLYAAVIQRCRPALLDIATDRGELGSGSRIARRLRVAFRKATIKGEYWATRGMPQWLAGLTARVPWILPVDAFVGRDKFQHYRVWLAGALSDNVKDCLLSDAAASTVLDRTCLEAMINEHVRGVRNYEAEIGKAMMIAVTERVLLRQGA